MFNLFTSRPKKYENLTAEAFQKLILQKDTVLVDVRSAGEFMTEKIPGARNIDIQSGTFSELVKNLPKDKTYLLYCRSGRRSAKACSLMAEFGFTKLKNLSNGIGGWPFDTV